MDIEQIATAVGLLGAGFGALWALGRGGGSIRAITPIGQAVEGQTVRVRGRVRALDRPVRSSITDTPCVACVSRVRNDLEDGRVVTGIDLVRDLTGERFVIEDTTGRARVELDPRALDWAVLPDYETRSPSVVEQNRVKLIMERLRVPALELASIVAPHAFSEHRLHENDAVVVVGVGRWELETERQGGGYRESARRLVLTAGPQGPLIVCDDTDEGG